MSDGNFNRALLPKNELSSGLRAGKAQMRTKAEQALKEVIERHLSSLPAATKEAITQDFMALLRK